MHLESFALKKNAEKSLNSSKTLPDTNMRSIKNKLDKLSALLRYDCDCHRSSLLCFTEIWWFENSADCDVFNLI